ncbi:hypothetical protein LguiA_013197 [Lonicera macranthoides]
MDALLQDQINHTITPIEKGTCYKKFAESEVFNEMNVGIVLDESLDSLNEEVGGKSYLMDKGILIKLLERLWWFPIERRWIKSTLITANRMTTHNLLGKKLNRNPPMEQLLRQLRWPDTTRDKDDMDA